MTIDIDDISALESSIIDRVKATVPDLDVVQFPQDGTIITKHPIGTVAVRFAALQPGEITGIQTDRLAWTFELNVVMRNLHTNGPTMGMYSVLSKLFDSFHGASIMLPSGMHMPCAVSLIDFVTLESGVWIYIVSLSIIAPHVRT